jgi:hypothetical protein
LLGEGCLPSDLGWEQEDDSELAAVPAISLRAQSIKVFDAILTPADLKFLLEFVSDCVALRRKGKAQVQKNGSATLE